DALDAGHVGYLADPRAGCVDGHAGMDVHLVAGARVAHPGAADLVALAVDGGHRVVREDPAAALLDPLAHRPHGLPDIDVGVGDLERPCDPRVETRLRGERVGDRDLLAVHAGVGAALSEAIGVGGVVVLGGDEHAAGVLDAVGGHAAQDPVLADALLRGPRVLDGVAPAGVQQAVEAPAGALGQILAV